MRALSSPRLPLPELMELCLHRLHPGLDVVPAVPSRLVMNSVHLMDVRHVYRVDLMHRRPFLPRRRRGGRGRRRTRDRVELVMVVDAAGVHRVRDVRVSDLGLVLEFEPTADQRRRRRPVRRRPPLGNGAAATRALVLLRGVLAAKPRTTRPALGRGFEVRGGSQLRRGPRVPRVPRRQPRPRPTGRLRRRGRGQRLHRHEPPRLRVDRLQRGQLLAVPLVHVP